MHAARPEIPQPFLETPQLGVTKRSPVSAIENQDRAVWRKQIGQGDAFAVLIRQGKSRRVLAHPRGLRGKRHLPEHVKNFVGEKAKREQREDGKDRAEDFAVIKLRPSKSADEPRAE